MWHWVLNLNLWPRTALTISLAFLALFAAFATLGEWALADSTDRLLDKRLVIAQMAASQIDGLLQRVITELEQAQRIAVFTATNPDLTAESGALTHTFDRVGAFAIGIIFSDSTGKIILSYPPSLSPLDTDLSASPHIMDALSYRGVTISTPFVNNRRPVAAISVPVFNGNRFEGVLSALVNLSIPAIMGPLQQATTSGETEHAALVDNQGRSLASTFDLPFLAPGEHTTFYRRALARGVPTVETVPFEIEFPGEKLGELHTMAFVPLRLASWGVAVGGDVNETLAGVRRLWLGMALLGTAVLSSVWAVTLVGTRRLMRPIQYLTRAAQRIAQGDLQTPLQLSSETGEIGTLAGALEHMRSQLLANIEALAQWNDTLETRVAEQTAELRQQQTLSQQLFRRAITAQEDERGRLARELHDDIGQTLTAVQLSLDHLNRSLPGNQTNARDRLERSKTLVEQSLADLRRIIAALRPGVLDQLGLLPALGWTSDHTLRPLGINVTIEADGLYERLPGAVETILFRIAQEAMNNVARHSQGTCLVITVARQNDQVVMTLADDGQGYNLSVPAAIPERSRGLGLAGMQERASLAGGQVTMASIPGRGTTVQVVIPLSGTATAAEAANINCGELEKRAIER